MTLKIAIIGAGPAGCMLARLLAYKSGKAPISVTIFESEASINFRSQGGTLDLHEATGLKALREAAGAGKKGAGTGRPEIDRPKLRQMLFESLPEGTVRWQHKLSHVDDEGTLHFANEPFMRGFDLVVGADGGWSKVRPALSDVKPFYSGIGGHAFSIPEAEQNTPKLYTLVNRGSIFSWSDGKGIFAQYMGDGSLNIGTWALRPKDWQKSCGYDVHDGKAVKQGVVSDYSDWDPRLVAFTQEAEDNVMPRDLYMLPVGHRWKHGPGLTLIGDAAHLMTPFAGEGVNLAFADSIRLADAILRSSNANELDGNVRAFEEDMFERAAKTTQLTLDSMHHMFLDPGSPRVGVERYLLRLAEDQLGWWLTKLATPLVYAWFFVFKLIW